MGGFGSGFPVIALAAKVSGEGSFFDPSVHARFFGGFQCRRLGVGESRFRAALGKGPTPAAPGLDQKEFDVTAAHPVANRRNLFASAQLSKL